MPQPRVTIAPRRSVALFALLAILMVIVSYVVIVALAAACVYLPYLVLTSMETANLQVLILFLGGIAAAGAMLWSLVPRREKFEAPGLLIERSEHPALFGELDDIATSLNEPVPREVYLIGQVNAFVSDRGGLLGFGSRRILGIGLPLLSLLTVSELRGVLAHEFAHYYSGDTRMGPWVYRTQSAMIRSFQNIGSLRQVGRIGMLQMMYQVVAAVLKWNFLFFLRVINFVSRRKEFRADELACLVAGKEPMIEGLRKIHGGAMAWQAYWNTEAVPVLQRGYIAALGDGLVRFLAAPQIAEQVARGMEKELAEAKTNPYDTHPPLRDRIAAMEKMTAESRERREEPALSLLSNPETAELRFLESLNPNLPKGGLRRVSWDEVGPMVTIPAWQSAVGELTRILSETAVESLVETVKDLAALGSRIPDPKGMLLAPEQRKQRAGHLLAMALGLTLLEKGWQLEAQPGNFFLYRGSERVDVFELMQELAKGKITPEAWRERCKELGIAGAPLCPAAGAKPAEA
jgi:heat shock protein HtpX